MAKNGLPRAASATRARSGRVGRAAGGIRVTVQRRQKPEFLALERLAVIDAIDQHLQRGRITGAGAVAGDATFFAGLLVGVDGIADFTQGEAQFLLLRALHAKLRYRYDQRGKYGDDGQRDHHLDQREAAAFHGRAPFWGAGGTGGGTTSVK